MLRQILQPVEGLQHPVLASHVKMATLKSAKMTKHTVIKRETLVHQVQSLLKLMKKVITPAILVHPDLLRMTTQTLRVNRKNHLARPVKGFSDRVITA